MEGLGASYIHKRSEVPESLLRAEDGDGKRAGITYYEVPPVKHSDYRFKTAFSFFSEGIAGASQLIATIVDLTSRQEDRALVRSARYISTIGSLVAALLFVVDLKTRQRFLNMLRIFRPTSPMSIGTWTLTEFSMFSTLTLAAQALEDLGFPRTGRALGRWLELPAASLGSLLAVYMGTEMEETSTPLWASAHPVLAGALAAGNMGDAVSALQLVGSVEGASEKTQRRLDQVGAAAGVLQMSFACSLRRRWRKEKQGQPGSAADWLYNGGVLGFLIGAPLAARWINAVTRRRRPGLSLFASATTLAGGLLMPSMLLIAGNRSADQPKNYFEYTRQQKLPALAAQGSGSTPETEYHEPHPSGASSRIASFLIGFAAVSLGAMVYGALQRRRSA